METIDTLSSCSDSKEMEMQRLQKKESIMKGSFINGLSALKSHLTFLSKKDVPGINKSAFERAFSHIFAEDVHTFTRKFSKNMATLETQLSNETLHESNCKTAFIVLKTPFEKLFTSVLIKSSSLDGSDSRKDFKAYTRMEPQVFIERTLVNFDFIEKYMIESILHNKEIKKRMNAKRIQKQGDVDMDSALDASSVITESSDIDSGKKNTCSKTGNDQSSENQSNTSGDESSRSCNDKSTSGDDTDIIPSCDIEPLVEVPNTAKYNVFSNERQHSEKHAAECADERAALANLIANLSLDTEENKTILKQLKKANASLTQELEKCNTNLDETSRALGEATSCRDSCLIALQNKQNEFEKYKAFNDRTIDYDILQTKLNETLGLLALKDIEIKEGLKTKAYEISVLNQKHDELVKRSLLTKSQFEGQLKEKSKVISDLKVKEGRDIDKMIEMDKQIKFLNEILYKRNQSIQTIHMLAPKCATYNGRSTFDNPKYLKIAQSKKPCLYEIPYNTSDHANRFCPNGEEIVTLEKESRSKLNKDIVKPSDYTYQNNLYEIFKPPSKTYLDQLERAKEVRKTMWRKTFVRTKPNIAKNVTFLPVSKSISKSRQAYNEMTNNFDHFRTICEQAWFNHTRSSFRNPTAHDMEVLIKSLLMPLSIKTINDSYYFVHELKMEMHEDFEYVESLEKEIDELESEKANFSNIYDLLLEECVSKDVICSYLHSLSDLNAHTGLQCLYLHKVKECECLAQKLSKQTESVNKEVHNNLLKSFSKLEKHSISLELALQQCKEQMKNNSVCKENGSNVFRKEREQYHEIQDLKAQMQDKNIAISELKKLIEKSKGKSIETQFDKPSVVRQPNAQRIPKPSILGKPTPFSNSPKMRRMYRIATSTTQNREQQLPHASRNTNPHVSKSTGVVPNNSQVKFTKNEVEDHHRISSISKKTKSVTVCNNSSNSRTSNVNAVCAECGKCVFNSNHDACVSRYLKDVNSRTKKPKAVPISASKPKRKVNKSVATPHKKTVASDTTIQKPKSYFKELYENTNHAWKWWIEKKCPSEYKSGSDTNCLFLHALEKKCSSEYKWTQKTPSRPSLKWKPTSRIFSNVRLRWIPKGKLFNSCTGKVESEPTHGSNVDIPHIHACKQTLDLSVGTLFNGQKQQRIDLNADALYNEKQENLKVWPRSSTFLNKEVQALFLSVKWRLLKITLQAPPRSSTTKTFKQRSSSLGLHYTMTSVHISSGLILHQITSDHNHSELRIHDHSNEPSSSKLVPKVIHLAVKTATSRQELELLFHHHIAMLRTTEHPSDTNVFTMKMEILLEPASNKLLVGSYQIELLIWSAYIQPPADESLTFMKMPILGANVFPLVSKLDPSMYGPPESYLKEGIL
ncbi:hypothetical protein Tco_0001236 [Tanacetum coccineum]